MTIEIKMFRNGEKYSFEMIDTATAQKITRLPEKGDLLSGMKAVIDAANTITKAKETNLVGTSCAAAMIRDLQNFVYDLKH